MWRQVDAAGYQAKKSAAAPWRAQPRAGRQQPASLPVAPSFAETHLQAAFHCDAHNLSLLLALEPQAQQLFHSVHTVFAAHDDAKHRSPHVCSRAATQHMCQSIADPSLLTLVHSIAPLHVCHGGRNAHTSALMCAMAGS